MMEVRSRHIYGRADTNINMGIEETTHQNKECTSTKGADGSSSANGKMVEVIGNSARSKQKMEDGQINEMN